MQTMQTEIFLKIFYHLIFFILIFLTCDILEKRKEKLELVYKGDGLVKNFLLQVSVFVV